MCLLTRKNRVLRSPLLSLTGFVGVTLLGGCTLITDVDRTKIEEQVMVDTPMDEDGGTDAGTMAAADSGSKPTKRDSGTSSTTEAGSPTDGGPMEAGPTSEAGTPAAPDSGKGSSSTEAGTPAEAGSPPEETPDSGSSTATPDASPADNTTPDAGVDAG